MLVHDYGAQLDTLLRLRLLRQLLRLLLRLLTLLRLVMRPISVHQNYLYLCRHILCFLRIILLAAGLRPRLLLQRR